MKRFYLLFIFIGLGCASVGGRAHALTLSPAEIQISGAPGQTVSGQFFILNDQGDGTFYSSTQNFEANGDSGTPSFTTTNTDLASWISVAPSFMLKQGAQAKAVFQIHIPKNATAGGHFAAVFLSTLAPQGQKGSVGVGARLGVLVLLRVTGDIKTGGGLVDSGLIIPTRFYASLPVGLYYHYANTGNDRLLPSGTVTVKNIFGGKTAVFSANPLAGNVLPGSTRLLDTYWGAAADANVQRGFFGTASYELTHFALGPYHLQLAVSAAGLPAATVSYLVFVIPWQLLLILLIIVPAIVFTVIWGVKRYNQWVISRK